MRILMVLENSFPPDVRVEKEIKSLIEAGYEIVLACSSPKSKTEIKKWNNATIISRKMSVFIYKSSVGCLKFPFYFSYWKKYLLTVIQKYSFDAIHLHDLRLSKVINQISKKHRLPFILDLHENWPAAMAIAIHTNTFLGRLLSSTEQWYRYEAKYTSEADRVITVIEEMKKRISNYDINQDNVIVLPNVPYLNKKSSLIKKKKDDKFTIFYSGGIQKHRGLQIVLQAIKKLENENIHLLIAGDGSYMKILQDYCQNQSISVLVTFLGWQESNKLFNSLKQTDLAIIPHIKSTQTDNSSPNKLYEYGLSGKAVLASDCNSIVRYFKETKAGKIYRHDNPEELAEKILNMRNNPEMCQKMGENGRNAVLKKYNWKNMVRVLLEMYSVLESK